LYHGKSGDAAASDRPFFTFNGEAEVLRDRADFSPFGGTNFEKISRKSTQSGLHFPSM
jgi:hypothetical protein